MDVETLLVRLFDFQRLEAEPTLQDVIDQVTERYFCRDLPDETLVLLSAAGDPFALDPDPPGGEKLP